MSVSKAINRCGILSFLVSERDPGRGTVVVSRRSSTKLIYDRAIAFLRSQNVLWSRKFSLVRFFCTLHPQVPAMEHLLDHEGFSFHPTKPYIIASGISIVSFSGVHRPSLKENWWVLIHEHPNLISLLRCKIIAFRTNIIIHRWNEKLN